jgi:Trypsin-like peptidase domain
VKVRHVLYVGLAASIVALAFSLGSWNAQRTMALQLADNDARLAALGVELARSVDQMRAPEFIAAMGAPQSAMVQEIKRQLQSEMGLMPVRLLRERRASFVELNTVDSLGKEGYGTAGYLGNGYFITVKHGVVVLDDQRDGVERHMTSITLRYKDKDVPAEIVDAGDATFEVHTGDWALIKVNEAIDLPSLNIDTTFGYEFAEPIFRLGNDYSRGIIVGTGYVGQHTANGLVTCLTDGHPGVSGGGVLNQNGDLVGIPVGRMQQDYRFSFILPVRPEMFRMLPQGPAPLIAAAQPATAAQ